MPRRAFHLAIITIGVLFAAVPFAHSAHGFPPQPAPSATVSIPQGKELTIEVGRGVKLELVLIPAGSFQMGSDGGNTDEKPAHKVTFSHLFYLGKYEVTNAQWEAVMGSIPSYFKGGDHPVEQVTWNDTQDFLKRLTAKGDGNTYRLPTEAEWEYAAQAGSTGRYGFGDDENQLDQFGWYGYDKAGKTSHPVGSRKPNAFGVYDMHGGVWEWCQDWYNGNYYGESQAPDPPGPSSGSVRVLRGGSWGDPATNCRSGYRNSAAPDSKNLYTGFRIVGTAAKH